VTDIPFEPEEGLEEPLEPEEIEIRDPFAVLDPKDNEPGELAPDDKREIDLVAAIMRRKDESYGSSIGRRRLWEYLHLMTQGEPLLARTKLDQNVLRIVTEEDPRQPRSRDNLFRQTTRAFVGKMVRTIPTMTVSPASADRDDMIAAEIAESFKDHIERKEKIRVKYKRAMEFLPQNGTAVWEILWDPDGGNDIWYCNECSGKFEDEPPEGICPSCYSQDQARRQKFAAANGFEDPSEQQFSEVKKAKMGDLKADLHDAEDFFPDPSVSEPEDMEWCIFEKTLSVAKVRRMHPDKADLIQPEGDLYSDRYVYAPTGMEGARIETTVLDNHVRYYRVYEAPSGEHEQGRIICMANGRILDEKPNLAYMLLGRHPVFLSRGDRVKKSIWGEELLLHAEPLQKERDNLGSQLRAYREIILNPQYLVDSDAGINEEQLQSRPGRIIKRRRGRHIEPVPMAQMPQAFVETEMERLKVAVEQKLSVSPYDMGAGQGSGRFAAIMDTRSAEAVQPLTVENDDEFKEMYRAIIIMGRYFYPDDYVWAVRGKGKMMSKSWGETVLKPGWDLSLDMQDSLSKNPVIRRQEAIELLNTGYYMDQASGMNDWEWFRRDAGLKYDGTGADDEESERIYFAQLPSMIEASVMGGEMPQVGPFPWDDARVATDEIMKWLRQNRHTKPIPILVAVHAVWQVYAQAMMVGGQVSPQMAKYIPNIAMGGAGTKNPAGIGQPMGEIPADQETQERVAQADGVGEETARPGMPHEG
jgi:rubrerythrin